MTTHRRGHRPAPRVAHRRGSALDEVLRPLRREPAVGQALLAFLIIAVMCHLLPWVTVTGKINAETVIGFGSISGVFSALMIIGGIALCLWWMFVPTPIARYLIGGVALCAAISLWIALAVFLDARQVALTPIDGEISARKQADVGLPLSLIAIMAVIVLSGVRLWQQARAERPPEDEDPIGETSADGPGADVPPPKTDRE